MSDDFEALCGILNLSQEDAALFARAIGEPVERYCAQWEAEAGKPAPDPVGGLIAEALAREGIRSGLGTVGEDGTTQWGDGVTGFRYKGSARLPKPLRTLAGIARAVETLRTVGARLSEEGERWPSEEGGEKAFVPCGETGLLQLLANYQATLYRWGQEAQPQHDGLYLLTQAARDLWPVMAGQAKLRRCPAPAPGRGSTLCRKWFVTGGKAGRPRVYCSDRCAKRAEQRKRRQGPKGSRK